MGCPGGSSSISASGDTSPASQKVQRRDLALFLHYMATEERTDQRVAWTPRLSRDFQRVQQTVNDQGRVWVTKPCSGSWPT